MRSIELFAGIGGIALAAEWAGIETVAFCEREPFAQKVLNKHWPDVPIFDDVCTLNRKALEEKGVIEPNGTIDIISGGFPCQPFSIAGNKKGKEDDRDLWPEMFRIIEELRPRWIVGENVANFVNMELDRTLFDLESIGYRWRAFVLPACAVNANHRRDRTFVVAHSNSARLEERNVANQPNEQRLGARENIEGILCNTNSKPESQTDSTVSTFRSKRESWEGTAWKYRGTPSGSHWETDKPTVCRMDDGISARLDNGRLKALGNAVVPQQIYPIFKYIREIERGNQV